MCRRPAVTVAWAMGFLALGLSAPALAGAVAETFGVEDNAASTHPGALRIARSGSGGSVVEVDISALAGAKVYHASLCARRQGKGLEDRQDQWLRPVLVYRLGPEGEDVKEGAKPLALEPPWYGSFDVTEAVAQAAGAKARTVRFLVKELYRWIPDSTELAVVWEGQPEKVPQQVAGVKVFHNSGNTFITFDEIEKLVQAPDLTIGEYKKARADLAARDKTNRVRYRILRHTAPITAGNAGAAVAVAEVAPLSVANIDGGLDHFGRAQETQNRLVVEDGKDPLPWGRGLYVHTTTEKDGTFHYAVVTVVNGRANLKDFSAANAPPDALQEAASRIPVPVLQKDVLDEQGVYGGVRKGARVRLYVTWNAEPYFNVPNQTFNWSVTIDEKQWASVAPIGLYLHEWAGTHVRTTWGWPGGRSGILVAGNDCPPQTWWYGFSDALGTLKSWGGSEVHNYTERRVLAFLDWVASKWAVDRDRVFAQGGSMGGAGIYTFALRNGDRFAAVFGNVGIADWTVPGTSPPPWNCARAT